jgi:hypothetical protein
MRDHEHEAGFLIPLVRIIFGVLKYFSVMGLLELRWPKPPAAVTECYVFVWLLVEFIAALNITKIAGWASWLQIALLALASLKILEIVRVTMSVVLFDEGTVASVQRTFILAAINFLELGLCFGFFMRLIAST